MLARTLESAGECISITDTANRILENSEVYDFELSDREMVIIEALDQSERMGPDPDRFGWAAWSSPASIR